MVQAMGCAIFVVESDLGFAPWYAQPRYVLAGQGITVVSPIDFWEVLPAPKVERRLVGRIGFISPFFIVKYLCLACLHSLM